MAAIKSQATCLLFILLATSSNLVTGSPVIDSFLKTAAFGGVPRKLLQGASGSTVFGTPPPGTLVVTWNLIPAKTVGGQFPYGSGAQPPPYQYDWFNINPAGCAGCANILFYPVSAYVAGTGSQQTQLVSTGGCDTTSTQVSDIGTLFSSCSGSFTVPNNGTLTVTQIWDFLQVPPGLQFQLPTPFSGFNCTFFLDGPSPAHTDTSTFLAIFDNGQTIPVQPPPPGILTEDTGLFGAVGFISQPYNQQGTLTFQSINQRINYVSAVPFQSVAWSFGYSYCVFASTQLTAQPIPQATSGTAPVPQPTAGSTCDPQSVNSNQCFNSQGDQFVCCPGSCGPPGSTATCKNEVCSSPGAQPKGAFCDPNSANPNQCFNEDGSCYVCCARGCGTPAANGPTCSA